MFIKVKYFFYLSYLIGSLSFANESFFSIAVCTTADYVGAVDCKNKIIKKANLDVYIVQNSDLKFRTIYGSFDSYRQAQKIEKNLPKIFKAQQPFVRTFESQSLLSMEKFSPTNHLKGIQLTIKKDLENAPLDKNESTTQLLKEEAQEIVTKDLNLSTIEPTISIEESLFNEQLQANIDEDEDKNRFFDSFVLTLRKLFNEDTNEIENTSIDGAKPLIIQENNISDDNVAQENFENSKMINNQEIENNQTVTKVPETKMVSLDNELKPNKPQEKVLQKEIAIKQIVPAHLNSSQALSNIQLNQYESMMITVDSVLNKMQLQGYKNGNSVILKEYIVSTGRKNIQKPLGEGKVTAISFLPIWYPTTKTIEAFKAKGIDLPAAVPYGHKYNYMGAAKIYLSHIVNGKNVYRIHGTLNEKTIGTNESGGCIRMKNNDVLELAHFLKKFQLTQNSFNNVKVLLK